jgi:hypothetical protein
MIYELHTSTGQTVRIDDEDLNKIAENTDQFMVKVKQGIIRPPFISVIIPTGEDEWRDKLITKEIEGRVVVTGREKVKRLGDLMKAVKTDDGKNLLEVIEPKLLS